MTNNTKDYGSSTSLSSSSSLQSSSLSPEPTSTSEPGNSAKVTPILMTSPACSYNRYNNTTPHSEGPLHRYKRPIKPALKNGKIRSLSLMSSQQSPSLLSTPKSYKTNQSYSYNTPPSSSASRQHLINNKNYRGQKSNHDDNDDAWRKDGKDLREKLLEEDDASGGNEFVINRQCKLKNYCDIADRVSMYFFVFYNI